MVSSISQCIEFLNTQILKSKIEDPNYFILKVGLTASKKSVLLLTGKLIFLFIATRTFKGLGDTLQRAVSWGILLLNISLYDLKNRALRIPLFGSLFFFLIWSCARCPAWSAMA